MLSEIQKDSGHFRPFEIEMRIGEEVLNAYFENKRFSISAAKNKELEEEITDKLDTEFKKKYPRICQAFAPRIYENK
jgi:predicted solute-binding protein